MPAHKHKRAPSIDMTAIGLRNASVPSPIYSSMFRSQDHSFMLHQMYDPPAKDHASKRPCLSNARTGTTYVPAFAQEETPQVDEKSSPTKPELHNAARPHDANASAYAFGWPSLPSRASVHPRRRISIPWILAVVFCVTLVWFISIALGAGLFSALYSEPANPIVQKIYLVINGEVLDVSIPAATLPDILNITVPVAGSTTASVVLPTTSVSGLPTATEGLIAGPVQSQDPQRNPETIQVETSKPRRSVDTRPTGFVTLTRT